MYNIGDVSEDEQATEVDADTDADTDANVMEDLFAVKDKIPSVTPAEITPQHWPIDYLSYVHHLRTQDQSGTTLLAQLATYNRLEPRLEAYLEKYRLAEEYTTNALPMGDGPWIDRLKSLAVVTFKLDEFADVNEHYLEDMSFEHVKQVSQRKEKRRQDLELAVQFVQIHTTMFRGTLKQVLCPEDSFNGPFNVQCCPADILDRMLMFLPMLIEPTELVNRNWKQFVAKAEHTNLERVTKIQVLDQYVEEWYDQLRSKPFPHRCPSLRKYNMMSLGPDGFKWAVQRDVSDNDQDQDQYQHQHQHEKQAVRRANLPPLEIVSINARKESFGSELDDIGVGFGPNLKSFSIRGFRYESSPGGSQPLHIGRGWRMPVLSRFAVQLPSEELVLDPDFLSHCPSLRVLILDDNMETYDLNRIRVAQPAHLPELTKLVLVGTGALSFHPDTLHSTKELKMLHLGLRNFRRTFLPSFEAMEQYDQSMEHASEDSNMAPVIHRPKWNWDWYLPNMTTLVLSVEFSLHFQFQMLRGTPKLEDLSLCLYSTAHQVERVLIEDDFILKSWDQEQEVY